MDTRYTLTFNKVQLAVDWLDKASDMMLAEFRNRLNKSEFFAAQEACEILQQMRVLADSVKKYKSDVPSVYEFINIAKAA